LALAATAGIASRFTALLHLLFLGGSLLIGAAATAAVFRAGRGGRFPRIVLDAFGHGIPTLRAEIAQSPVQRLNRDQTPLNVREVLDSYFATRPRLDLQTEAPRAGALHILAMPYVPALGWVTVPIAILSAVAGQAPVTVALLPLLPAVAVLALLAMEVAELSEFCRARHELAPAREHGRLLACLPGYEAVQALAAARAVALHPCTSPGGADEPRAPRLVHTDRVVVAVAAAITVIDLSLLAHLLAIDIPETGRGVVLPFTVSLVLAGSASGALLALCRSWRSPGWLVAVTSWVHDGEPTAAPAGQHRLKWLPDRARTEALLARWYASLHPRVGAGGESSRRFWRFVLVLAVTASALWLTWARRGLWEAGLLVAVAIAFAQRRVALHRLPGFSRMAVPAAHRVRRLSAVAFAQRTWRGLPEPVRGILPLLVIFNLLVAVELGGTALFLILAAVDLYVLHRVCPPSSRRRLTRPPISPPDNRRGASDSRERSAGNRRAPAAHRARAQPAIAITSLIVAIAWIAYSHPGPALIPAVLVVGLTIPSIADIDREQATTMVLSIAVVVATVDYVSWRFGVTNWQGWWIAAPLVLAEAFGAVHVLGFQLTIWPRPQPQLEPTEDPTRRPIFVFIPTLNEGVGILRPTIDGCIAARDRYLEQYPGAAVTIVICNDGRVAGSPVWEEVEALAREVAVSCVSRTQPGGAKAGNIENARQAVHATGDALLAVFDADQVPKPEFLLKTVPPFADAKVGWVQTGQYYANLANPVSRWADDQQSMFYNLLCPGKAAMNAAFICGTNVVLRAAALDEIGGLPQDSVTEDFAASIRLHPRWRSIYLTDVLATGLGPLDLPSYFRQQGRWALGTLGVLRTNWRDILLPRRHGLRLSQRAQYFLACTHYLCGVRDLIYLVSPLLFIATGVPAVHSASLTQYLLHFIPYAGLGLLAMWYAGSGVMGPRGIIVGFGSFPALLESLLAVVLNRKRGFAATSKKHQGRASLLHVCVHLVLLGLCVVCLVWATVTKGEQATSLFISVMWIVYSLAQLGSFLWLALQDAGLAAAIGRWGAGDEVASKVAYCSRLLTRLDRATPTRNVAIAALVACPLLFTSQLRALPVFVTKTVTPFVISREPAGPPYMGVSVPAASLRTRPALVERDLGESFSIVGRTQDVQDRFDTGWADALAAHHARPWITLEFGVFGPHHVSPLNASLPAIVNGVDDAALTRWATEIRQFGKPVYLTILRHVDKNWSLSSGVANGGIPEDAPKAWLHAQSIFHAAGATNVAWVWAPADPANDQQFAPPPSSIDAVLQSFINYPGTRWGNPAAVMGALTRRYPRKPIFVDASVSGPAYAKTAWLNRLSSALDATPQLYAFLYHEGGPNLTVTPAEMTAWSLASDPLSLDAMRHMVADLRSLRRYR
jgi:cellulose synthase (UDP-forming)